MIISAVHKGRADFFRLRLMNRTCKVLFQVKISLVSRGRSLQIAALVGITLFNVIPRQDIAQVFGSDAAAVADDVDAVVAVVLVEKLRIMGRENQNAAVTIEIGVHKEADQRGDDLLVKVVFDFVNEQISAGFQNRLCHRKRDDALDRPRGQILFEIGSAVQHDFILPVEFQVNKGFALFFVKGQVFHRGIEKSDDLSRNVFR